MQTTTGEESASLAPPAAGSCDEHAGLVRRLCQVMRRLVALAGRGGSSGVPF